ncbi:Defensin-like protein 19 [Striga hermonthica]|uniref:Defensin-like protein 19 n=1 Tax=Striga hermonthica TaxID=68872 RepID=A0A9N7N3J4_STRHE|nr:Defensin-like protein 19 [Striga hermonthica]
MAKSQVSLCKLFALFISFLLIASCGIPVAEGGSPLCSKMSQTWSGFCGISKHCDNQCRKWEKAERGACHHKGLGFACFCYFKKC